MHKDLKGFLIESYTKIAICAVLIIFIVAFFQDKLLLSSAIRVEQNRITSVVGFHKNEMIDEVALNNRASLIEHIDNLLWELNVDSIEIKTDLFDILRIRRENNESLLSKMIGTIANIYTISPLSFDLSNDYGSFRCQLTIKYSKAIFLNHLLPVYLTSVALVIIFTILMMFFAYQNFRIIDLNIIFPIAQITKMLASHDTSFVNALKGKKYLLQEIDLLNSSIVEFEMNRRSKITSDIYLQVAHDIRSPLAAMEMLCQDIDELASEKKALLKSILNRVRDIANQLLSENRKIISGKNEGSLLQEQSGASECVSVLPPVVSNDMGSASPEMLSSLIAPLVSEKRVQYRALFGVDIEAEFRDSSYILYACVNPLEFQRVLSNLIDNAIQSIESGPGKVRILLSPLNDRKSARIEIVDTGKGIPKSVLDKLGSKGYTYGKENGSGLGLYYSKNRILSWAGKFNIESTAGLGTRVIIELPLVAPPSWLAQKVEICTDSTLVVVDDDDSIHHIWNQRLAAMELEQKPKDIVHFSSIESAKRWIMTTGAASEKVRYLVDLEFLGEKANGLDLVRECNIGVSSILVTSRYSDLSILAESSELGVKILPKELAGFIPFTK